MALKSLLLTCLIFNLIHGTAQRPIKPSTESRAAAAQELERVITEAKNVSDENAMVNITARAAMLVSYSDPQRAEKMFLDLWKFSNDATSKDLDKQTAKLLILKNLYTRNAKLARRLISEEKSQSDSSLSSIGLDDESTVPGKLASSLLEVDPAYAAEVLQQALSSAVNPAAVGALARLRETNSLLGDYVAASAIEALTARPTLVSLPGLHLLGAYVFPGAEAPIPSLEAESSRQSLQFRYFSAAYEVLRASLNESNEALIREQHYTPRLLEFRGAYQAELAAILAALAPRLQPYLAAELSVLAAKLAPQVPARMPHLPQQTLARLRGNFSSEDPEQMFFFSLSNGDLEAARSELGRLKDSEKRNMYMQLLIKSEARALLAKSELMEGVTVIRQLEDPTARLVMYIEALKTAKAKRDTEALRLVIDEAQLLIPQTHRNGLHLRALLAFVSQLIRVGVNDEATEFLKSAVSSINALNSSTEEDTAKTAGNAAMAELNDPNSLLDSPEMDQAFNAVGLLDIEVGLTQARRIQPKPVQLMARLDTIQALIKQGVQKPKASLPMKGS